VADGFGSKSHVCIYKYRSARKKTYGGFTAPCAYQLVSGWPSTGFRVMLNDKAHVESCQNVLVPYCHIIEKSRFGKCSQDTGSEAALDFQRNRWRNYYRNGCTLDDCLRAVCPPTKVVTVLKWMRVLQRIIVNTQNRLRIITLCVIHTEALTECNITSFSSPSVSPATYVHSVGAWCGGRWRPLPRLLSCGCCKGM
jgi:hypothetical protein